MVKRYKQMYLKILLELTFQLRFSIYNCLPNVFLQQDKISGFIDLGRCGIADRYQDIALCYRSLVNNYQGAYGGKVYPTFYPERLFEKLGIEPDWEKVRYYILLDELF